MDYTYENSVPLGEAGTGAAFLLPQSQAVNQVGAYIDSQEQENRRNALLKQQQAQKLAAAWQANQLKIKGGTLFQPEINKRAAEVMQMGLDLQKSGINPNTVSTNAKQQALVDMYHQKRTGLLSDVDTRDKIATAAQANEKAIQAQPDGYYDTDSLQAYHDYISGNTPLSDITSKGLQMPGLKRTYDLQAAVDKLPTAKVDTKSLPDKHGIVSHLVLPDKDKHYDTATNFLNNTPEAQASIAKKTGIPYDQIGNETDVNKVKQQIDDFWRSRPNIPKLAGMGIPSYDSPQYQTMIDSSAKRIAGAAKTKQDTLDMIAGQLDNKVSTTNDKTYDFKYQNEMRARERMGMERVKFNDWLENQQNEAGNFSIGNQDSYVPVVKQTKYSDPDVKRAGGVEPERGASLYGVNLPMVNTMVRPSQVTDIKTGMTSKNTEPMTVAVSQLQMVPVFKDLDKNSKFNGSEISARQLKEIVEGKNSDGATLQNITFQPFAYGTKKAKDDKGHVIETPIKFSYDALKGSNVKKINTRTFEDATDGLKQLQANPKFRSMSPQDQLNFISKKYNVKLD